jgi:hypothetical protein
MGLQGFRFSVIHSTVLFLALLIAAVLYMNNGQFLYVLDDPYIHLALAKQIAQGHYGLQADEFASPSSSLLWPLLLALFAKWSFFEYVPLVINIIAVLLTAHVMKKILAHVFSRHVDLLVFCILICGGGISLVFTGMEHSLQVLCTVVITAAMIDITEKRPVHGGVLFAALFMGPLVRYEVLGFSIVAAVLFWSYRQRIFIFPAILSIFLLVGFSYFLWINSGAFLPASVLAKMTSEALSFHPPILFVFLIIFFLLLRHFQHNRDRCLLVLCMSIFVMGHIIIGKSGWYGRYEAYVLIPLFLFLAYYALPYMMSEQRKMATVRFFKLLILASSLPYVVLTMAVPGASHCIYLQHVQMQKLAESANIQKVAVNDIGYMTFKSQARIYDLWGLGSYKVHNLRMDNNPLLFDQVVEQDVPLIMIYDSWFKDLPVPSTWQRLGTLKLTSFPGLIFNPLGNSEVGIYAVNNATAKRLGSVIETWKTTLPIGAVWQAGKL